MTTLGSTDAECGEVIEGNVGRRYRAWSLLLLKMIRNCWKPMKRFESTSDVRPTTEADDADNIKMKQKHVDLGKNL